MPCTSSYVSRLPACSVSDRSTDQVVRRRGTRRLGGIRSPALQEAVVVEQTADVGEVAGGLRPPVAFRVVVAGGAVARVVGHAADRHVELHQPALFGFRRGLDRVDACPSQCSMTQATCRAEFCKKCTKLVPNPACTMPSISRFGNSAERMPCSECAPSCQRSLSRTPSRPAGSKPSRRC